MFLALPSMAEEQNLLRNKINWRFIAKQDRPYKIPQLVYSKESKIIKKINRQIDLATKAPCKDTEAKFQVVYNRDNIFSIFSTIGYSCGGAYPTIDSPNSMTFDLASGYRVEFEDLFLKYKENKQEILEIIFEKQIERSKDNNVANEDGSCEKSNVFGIVNLLESNFDFALSQEGLEVQPVWVHAIEACAERVTVPVSKLVKFISPKGILTRIDTKTP